MGDAILSEFGTEPSLDNNKVYYEFLGQRQRVVREISKYDYFLSVGVADDDTVDWLFGRQLFDSLVKWATVINDYLELPDISDLLNVRKLLVVLSVQGYSRIAEYENFIENNFKCPTQVFDAIFPEHFFVFLVRSEHAESAAFIDPPKKSCTIIYDDQEKERYFEKGTEMDDLVEFLNQIK
jgi:hypothetical protein